MSGKLEVRLDRRDWEALDALCAERRVSRSALVRSLIHEARKAVPAGDANSRSALKPAIPATRGSNTPAGAVAEPSFLPVVPLELHRALGLPAPSARQMELYSNYPRKRGRLGHATEEELQAAWMIALSDPSSKTVVLLPDEDVAMKTFRYFLRSISIPKGLGSALRDRLKGIPATTSVPEHPLTRWVSVGMPADGQYPAWFREGLA